MNLSPTMRIALGKIIAEYDAAIVAELKRWGAASAEAVARKGIDPCLFVKGHRTLHGLEARGLITCNSQVREFQNRLRKGSWGRRIGGTVTDRYTQHMVVPTALGRAAFKQ